MNNLLKKISIMNEDNSISITNVIVIIFATITAFRSLFSGAEININHLTWKVEALDLSATLPLLFSLLNYHGKRMVNSPSESENK